MFYLKKTLDNLVMDQVIIQGGCRKIKRNDTAGFGNKVLRQRITGCQVCYW